MVGGWWCIIVTIVDARRYVFFFVFVLISISGSIFDLFV